MTFLRVAPVILATAIAVLSPISAKAAVQLVTADCDGGPVVAETVDGPMSGCGHYEDTDYAVGVIFNAIDATGSLAGAFSLFNNDVMEIAQGLNWGFQSSANVLETSKTVTSTRIDFSYRTTRALTDGDLIGTLTFRTTNSARTGLPLIGDEAADIYLQASAAGLNIYNSGTGSYGSTTLGLLEVQPAVVPLPVGALLLTGGIAALAGFRRRS